MNGEQICFGISEHLVQEYFPTLSQRARRDIQSVYGLMFTTKDLALQRPAGDSTAYPGIYNQRFMIQTIIGLLALRELPIKNFYYRSIVFWLGFHWGVERLWGRHIFGKRPLTLYNHEFYFKQLINFPDLFAWSIGRTVPTYYIRENPHIMWSANQKPVHVQYHKNVYRYRYRNPRYVPWDGTMSQPIMPYINEMGTGVINGYWKHRNTNDLSSKDAY